MKKMHMIIRLATIAGFSVFVQSVSMGSPYAYLPKPYPQFDPHPYPTPWPPIAVPVGYDQLLSRGCAVTSSDPDPIVGRLSYVTDGQKERGDSAYLELGPGLQWIQIDLGGECEVHAVCIWRYNAWALGVYRDVICQISNDSECKSGVVTVFNNDYDNSVGFGVGKDLEYMESHFGRSFAVDAVKGRYVRCYSRGSTASEMNHYTEIEVFGKLFDATQKEKGSKPSPTILMSKENAEIYDALPEPPAGKTWLKIEYPRGSFLVKRQGASIVSKEPQEIRGEK